jgi:small subunit ribosomal protein S1
MPATYDESGNYLYPEGFDSESGDWLEGFDSQREEWERQYAEARARFEAHRKQIEESRAKAEEEGTGDEVEGVPTASSSSAPRAPRGGSTRSGSSSSEGSAPQGTLASDEALAALRDRLSGGQS